MEHCNIKPPICKIGVIADVQYGDIDDVLSSSGATDRYYRKSLGILRRAVDSWQADRVDCILQLGDIIEGFRTTAKASRKALYTVLETLNRCKSPVYHTLGNHELYHFTKGQLMKTDLHCKKFSQCVGPRDKFYYSVNVHTKLRVIVLDCYDYSLLGISKTSPRYKNVLKFLKSKNPNEDLDLSDGMVGLKKRFILSNGGIGVEQMKWLEENLAEALQKKENVIVMGHIPAMVFPGFADSSLWDFEEVQEVLNKYRACVLCYLAGHLHDGAYDIDNSGMHHIVIQAAVECKDTDAYGTVYLYNNKLVLQGRGSVSSHEMQLKFPIE